MDRTSTWPTGMLGDVAESMKNGIYRPASIYADDGVACLRMYNIDAGRVVWRDIKRMRLSESEVADYQLLPGDILVNRVNSRELVGKAAVIPEGLEPVVFQSKNIRLRLDQRKAYSKFINYQLLLNGIRHFSRNAQQVVGMASISQKQLADFPVVLPPVRDQERIVAEIEKQFSRLDEAVGNLKRVKANLKRYRTAVISDAIGGASLAGTVCSTPWDWHEIHELAAKESNSITDGPFGSKLKTEHYTVSGPRVIRLQNVGDGVFVDEKAHISPEHFASLSRHWVYPGDLVIAALGETLPRACLVPNTLGPAIVKADCIRFKPGGQVLSKYLMYALNAVQTRRVTKARLHGVGRPRLNLGEIKSIVVPVPPLSTQDVIVGEVERRLSMADEMEAQVDASLQRAERLRQAILKRAFEGKLG